MDKQALEKIAKQMVAPGKGILAADESTGTMGKRLASIAVENAEEHRIGFRGSLFVAPGMEQYISGVILYDETLRQSIDGVPVPKLLADKGVVPGIKVDTGAKPLAGHDGETVTEGLDGLRERLAEYHALGARFAKWRAVIKISADGLPSDTCIHVNAHALARYAALCQEAGIVPIVEPEVLMDGDHDLETCLEVTEIAQDALFSKLKAQRVHLAGIVLKPSMVISGKDAPARADVATVAAETVALLKRTTPAAVAGIAFLSGGQSDEEATAHLDAMNKLGDAPWPLTFSYGRALQATALKTWGGKADRVEASQKAFLKRARLNSLAAKGEFDAKMEELDQ